MAKETVPRLFDCVILSSLMRRFSHCACVDGSPWICSRQGHGGFSWWAGQTRRGRGEGRGLHPGAGRCAHPELSDPDVVVAIQDAEEAGVIVETRLDQLAEALRPERRPARLHRQQKARAGSHAFAGQRKLNDEGLVGRHGAGRLRGERGERAEQRELFVPGPRQHPPRQRQQLEREAKPKTNENVFTDF